MPAKASPKRARAIAEITAAIQANGGKRPLSWRSLKTRRGVYHSTWNSWVAAAERTLLTGRDTAQAMEAVGSRVVQQHIVRAAGPLQFDFFAYIGGLREDVDLIRAEGKKNGKVNVTKLGRGIDLGIKLMSAVVSGYAEAWRAQRMKRFQDAIIERLKGRDPALAAQVLADIEAMDTESGVVFQEIHRETEDEP